MFLNQAFGNTVDAVKVFAADPLVAMPGEKYLYSTHGYAVVAALMVLPHML